MFVIAMGCVIVFSTILFPMGPCFRVNMTVFALSMGIHSPISRILPGDHLGSMCFFGSDEAPELCLIGQADAHGRSNVQGSAQTSFVVNNKLLHERAIEYVRLSRPVLRE